MVLQAPGATIRWTPRAFGTKRIHHLGYHVPAQGPCFLFWLGITIIGPAPSVLRPRMKMIDIHARLVQLKINKRPVDKRKPI